MMSFQSVHRVYQMKFVREILGENPLWRELGFESMNGSADEQFRRHLEQARFGEYETLLLPQVILDSEYWVSWQKWIPENEFKILVAHDSRLTSVASEKMTRFQRWSPLRIWDSRRALESRSLKDDQEFRWIIGSMNLREDLKSLKDFYLPGRTYFYFPYAQQGQNLFPKTLDLHDLIEVIKKHLEIKSIHPLPGVNIYDERAALDRETDPIFPVEILSTAEESSEILISVIIPTYNNKSYLANVVRHLAQQDLEPHNYEIVIVDDGSTDETKTFLLESLAVQKKINLKYIFFPRSEERKMGDHQFRAGIARNLGVKHSSGEILAFLDSDVLVPPQYLSAVVEKHQWCDITQAKRVELKKELSSFDTNYADIDRRRDTYIHDTTYWNGFLFSGRPWRSWPDGWKYTCTHSLTVKSYMFKDLGWFRTAFLYYGYEDTDLGQRFWNREGRFELLDIFVYHLHHADTRSEYDNSQAKKMLLLAKSAAIFYQNTLEDEVFQHCSYHFAKPSLLRRLLGEKIFKIIFPAVHLVRTRLWYPVRVLGVQTFHRARAIYFESKSIPVKAMAFLRQAYWSSRRSVRHKLQRVIEVLRRD